MNFLNNKNCSIIFGCEQLGGYEWGNLNIKEIKYSIQHAVEYGLNVFDTADCYGNGLSEKRLGQVLGNCRKDVLIASKYGVRLNSGLPYYDCSSEWAVTALDASLKRLKTDYLDLYQLHYWDQKTHLLDVVSQLEKFKQAGKIRHYGLTNISVLPNDLLVNSKIKTISLEYSLANRKNETTAKAFSSLGYIFLSYGSLGQGILSGKYVSSLGFTSGDRRLRKKYKNFHDRRLQNNLKIVNVLKKWSKILSAPVPKIAVSWIRKSVPGAVPIVGIKNREQLHDMIGLCDFDIPAEAFNELDTVSGDTDLPFDYCQQ